ncbi:MAG: guanylate kinase [Candidatus Saccharicenans sp.]|nr:guanylate kinase [Candidatus Saccharicenans sp.]MDH7492301.1 guanylate kinase [Candidatus Saccharicenans sp.]
MIYVISGPSGCGKSTLIKNLLTRLPGLEFSVSHTTRPKRSDEVDGQDYYFVTREEFEQMKNSGAFLEWAEVHGHLYGTSREEVSRKSSRGDLILDIDVQGARQVKKRLEGASFVFVVPPSYPELERRLKQRKTDPPEAIALRLSNARREILESNIFEYLVINGDLNQALEELKAIILSHRCLLRERQKEFKEILKSFKSWP